MVRFIFISDVLQVIQNRLEAGDKSGLIENHVFLFLLLVSHHILCP